jgi:hypothetical protein
MTRNQLQHADSPTPMDPSFQAAGNDRGGFGQRRQSASPAPGTRGDMLQPRQPVVIALLG